MNSASLTTFLANAAPSAGAAKGAKNVPGVAAKPANTPGAVSGESGGAGGQGGFAQALVAAAAGTTAEADAPAGARFGEATSPAAPNSSGLQAALEKLMDLAEHVGVAVNTQNPLMSLAAGADLPVQNMKVGLHGQLAVVAQAILGATAGGAGLSPDVQQALQALSRGRLPGGMSNSDGATGSTALTVAPGSASTGGLPAGLVAEDGLGAKMANAANTTAVTVSAAVSGALASTSDGNGENKQAVAVPAQGAGIPHQSVATAQQAAATTTSLAQGAMTTEVASTTPLTPQTADALKAAGTASTTGPATRQEHTGGSSMGVAAQATTLQPQQPQPTNVQPANVTQGDGHGNAPNPGAAQPAVPTAPSAAPAATNGAGVVATTPAGSEQGHSASSSASATATATAASGATSVAAPVASTAAATATSGTTAANYTTTANAEGDPKLPFTGQVLGRMRAMRELGDGTHLLQLKVHPENLGPVRIVATIGNGDVMMELHAASATGRDMLRAALGDMRRDFTIPGVNTSVNLSNDGGQNSDGRAAAGGNNAGSAGAGGSDGGNRRGGSTGSQTGMAGDEASLPEPRDQLRQSPSGGIDLTA